MVNPKENLLRAICCEEPEYVPRTSENIMLVFQFRDNFRMESWIDKWGVRWEAARRDMVPFPKGNPLPSLDKLDEYEFPNPWELGFTCEDEAYLRSIDRSSHLVLGGLTYFMFERAWALMGMENFFKSFFTHPKEMKRLLHEIANFNIGVFRRYLELGLDGVSISEDLGHQRGLMISPKIFREFFLPEYKRCFEELVREGKIVEFHSCGCIQDIIDDLIGVGITILNPVQARANDLLVVKDKCNGRIALKGGVDSHLLMLGPIDEIRGEVKRVINILAPGGGYIIGPDQSMPFPTDHVEALWATAKSYGKYPLSVKFRVNT
ncbi:MAG: uroporphyrinogen decarboxylase family protein [Candidatus Bathyarchaeia archaeon]